MPPAKKNTEKYYKIKEKEKKELKVIKIENTSLFGLKFVGGGELPAKLSGWYTNPQLALKAVADYKG